VRSNTLLRLRLDRDDDGTGELFVEVGRGGFQGASSTWVDQRRLANFGRQLQTHYPLPIGNPIEIAGGFWQQEGVEQFHVRLRVYPIGAVGTVGIQVTLATPLHDGDRAESQSSVSLELKTHYEQMRNFGLAVEALAGGKTPLAELESSDA
jgi:hypothetical protein